MDPVVNEPVVEQPQTSQKSLADKAMPFMMLVLLVMAFGLGTLWNKLQSTKSTQDQGLKVKLSQIKELWGKDLIKFGDANKKLLLVEVGDPSCPFCHVAGGKNPELNKQVGDRFKLVTDGGTYVAPVPEMKKLVDEGKASFVYVYTPGHGNGEMGMKALYCAFEKDKAKFWDVHDLLMTSQGYALMNDQVKNDKTKSGELAQFLARVIDADTMRGCLDSGRYDSRLAADVSVAQSLGVNGTPGFFLNETGFAGAYSWGDMEPVAKKALSKWF